MTDNISSDKQHDVTKEKPLKKEDPVALFILDMLAVGSEALPRDIAMKLAETRRRDKDGPDLWRKYMLAVRQQAKRLAREGKIQIIRNGEAIDPEKAKGLIRLRLPKG